jgi:hypothetical protein
MITRLLTLLLFVAGPGRHPFRFKFQLTAPAALATDSQHMAAALERGLFADSLIVPGSPREIPISATVSDSTLANMTRTMLVRGSVRESGQQVEVVLELENILARTVAGPDTVRVERAALDSALVAQGRHYAKLLANGRR